MGIRSITLLGAVNAVALAGCQAPSQTLNYADAEITLAAPDLTVPAYADPALDPLRAEEFTRFKSEADFLAWLELVQQAAEARPNGGGRYDYGGVPQPVAAPPPASAPMAEDSVAQESIVVSAARVASDPDNPEITNNQKAGVDEGGIVKQIGDKLIVLLDGRLFVVDLMPNGAPGLALVERADVYRSSDEDTWYDEILVSGRTILVTGYSYREYASEFTVLTLADDGTITRDATFYISSNDYYDTDNYATRMIDGNLVIHTPLYLSWFDPDEPLAPVIRRWRPENPDGSRPENEDGAPLFAAQDVYRPIQRLLDPVLHTVTVCPIEDASDSSAPDCTATAVIGSEDFEFLVTREDLWLWMQPSFAEKDFDWPEDLSEAEIEKMEPDCSGKDRPDFDNVGEGALVRLPIDGTAPSAAFVRGTPQDQFSMDMEDGRFRALLEMQHTACGYSWSQEQPNLTLVDFPLSDLSNRPDAIPERDYTDLPSPQGQGYEARFTRNHLVYAGRSDWGSYPPDPTNEVDTVITARAIVVDLDAPTDTTTIPLPHGVIRANPAGPYMALTGYRDTRGLNFSLIDLRPDTPSLSSTLVLGGRYESENRSHAFSSRIDADGAGMVAIPTVVNEAEAGRWWWWSDVSDVSYLSVTPEGRLRSAGVLAADPDFDAYAFDYDCEVSCTDWYGNTRPIFTNGRVFAMMNTEMVEGEMINGTLRQVRRLALTGRLE